jgi:hypothetical protein
MTSTEAENFLEVNGVSQCIRIFRRTDGKVMTDNCPRGLRALRNRCRFAIKVAAGIVTSMFALFPFVRAQAQDHQELRGDVYIPPKNEVAAPTPKPTPEGARELGGKPTMSPLATPAQGKGGKTVMMGESCSSQKTPAATTPKIQIITGGVPIMVDPRQTHTAVQGVNTTKHNDLADSKAFNLYKEAQKNEAEGKFILAYTQYSNAVLEAKAQALSDPKFITMLETARENLKLKMTKQQGN